MAAPLRWTLCATDRCFKTGALVPFFRAAKVLPVQRGGGMAQAGMAAAEDRLRRGDWVHIFPEGTRSRDGTMGPVRKGVGRLVAACGGELPPLVVPFVHLGMEEVMPRGKLLPATGKQVRMRLLWRGSGAGSLWADPLGWLSSGPTGRHPASGNLQRLRGCLWRVARVCS